MGIEYPLTESEVRSIQEAYMAANDDEPTPTWLVLKNLTSEWDRLPRMPMYVHEALDPFLRWVERIRFHPIPWRARWHILFTGKLPNDL